MDSNTQAILLMVWARSLGLPDDALSAPDELVRDTNADAEGISVLNIFGRTVISGPPWATDRVGEFSPEALTAPAGLLAVVKDRVPRVVRDEGLHYGDSYPEPLEGDDWTMTTDPAAYDELRATCTPDDLAQSGLDDIDQRLVLLDADERPVAAGGWTDWQGIVADLAFVAAVDIRTDLDHLPLARFVLGDVLDRGLIPQLRVGADASSSMALAMALGLQKAGSHLVVSVA